MGAFVGRLYAGPADSRARTIAFAGVFGALAMLPDLDVAWVAMGVADHGLGGHRGFTHTLAFAVLLGLLAAWWAVLRGRGAWRAALFVTSAVASHGVLDALTFDSRGLMLLWPLTDAKIAFDWRPIPSAPTGLAFIGSRGVEVAIVELLFFSPVALCAFRPPRSLLAARSATRTMAAIASLVVCSLFFAELVWRNVSVVSRLEAPSEREIALRERHRLRFP